MEEQILEIVRKHDAYLTTSKEMSKEITSMVMEFIEWMWFGSHQFRPYYNNDVNRYKDFYNDEDYTINKKQL